MVLNPVRLGDYLDSLLGFLTIVLFKHAAQQVRERIYKPLLLVNNFNQIYCVSLLVLLSIDNRNEQD